MTNTTERITRSAADIERLRQQCEAKGYLVSIIDGVPGVSHVYSVREWIPLSHLIAPDGEPLQQVLDRVATARRVKAVGIARPKPRKRAR